MPRQIFTFLGEAGDTVFETKVLGRREKLARGQGKVFLLDKKRRTCIFNLGKSHKKIIKPSWVRVDVDILGFALREHYAYIKPYYCTIYMYM